MPQNTGLPPGYKPKTLREHVNVSIQSGDKRPRRERYSPAIRGYKLAQGDGYNYRDKFDEIDWEK